MKIGSWFTQFAIEVHTHTHTIIHMYTHSHTLHAACVALVELKMF